MSELILYTPEDERDQIKLRAKDHTVWLSQREIAEPRQADAQDDAELKALENTLMKRPKP
ncbi:hypothetical protein [Azotobacter salinestris]|uniref:hypothetical protein n=1 Tax=Azotobacter salinestris TaxID=69964 RepID=UPI001AD78D0D|nr:hypothetical protein [Azotobacter salinestris]